MAKFPASARIPCRPLDMANKDLAEPKELIVDYETGNVAVCMADGSIVDISDTIKEIIKEDTTISESIQVEINGQIYNIKTIIADHAKNIEDILKALGYYVKPDGTIGFDILDKVASIDPDTGDVIFNITSTNVQETPEKQFVSQNEKDAWSKGTHPEVIKATILGGTQAWTGSEAPYSQRVNVTGILETDVPVVDISLGEIYDTIQKQLDSYAYIYKILTYDGYIMVYASQPTENDITIQMKVDRLNKVVSAKA